MDTYVWSLGWVIVFALIAVVSARHLSSTRGFQFIGSAIILACVVEWVAQFCSLGLHTAYLPPVVNQASVFSRSDFMTISVLMFSFVIALPSWLNEKHPSTPVKKPVAVAVLAALAAYLLVGVASAMAIQYTGEEGHPRERRHSAAHTCACRGCGARWMDATAAGAATRLQALRICPRLSSTWSHRCGARPSSASTCE